MTQGCCVTPCSDDGASSRSKRSHHFVPGEIGLVGTLHLLDAPVELLALARRGIELPVGDHVSQRTRARALTRVDASARLDPWAITPGSSTTSAIQRVSSSRSNSMVSFTVAAPLWVDWPRPRVTLRDPRCAQPCFQSSLARVTLRRPAVLHRALKRTPHGHTGGASPGSAAIA